MNDESPTRISNCLFFLWITHFGSMCCIKKRSVWEMLRIQAAGFSNFFQSESRFDNYNFSNRFTSSSVTLVALAASFS